MIGAATNLPKGLWLVRALTFTTGLGLQLLGLYAVIATFGAWSTLGFYSVGALAIALQHIALRRTPCSSGV